MLKLSLSDLFEYLCFGFTTIRNFLILSVRGRPYTSESDVCRRQILTYEDGPGAERVTCHTHNKLNNSHTCFIIPQNIYFYQPVVFILKY